MIVQRTIRDLEAVLKGNTMRDYLKPASAYFNPQSNFFRSSTAGMALSWRRESEQLTLNIKGNIIRLVLLNFNRTSSSKLQQINSCCVGDPTMNLSDPTEDQIEDYKEAFLLFDKENSGVIKSGQLGYVDVTGKEQIDFNQFCGLMWRHAQNNDSDEEFREAFLIFDRNEDGKINYEEFVYMISPK